MQTKRFLAMAGLVAAAVAAAAVPGCGRGAAAPGEPVTVGRLLERMVDPMSLPRLDRPDTKLYTSYDPAGGDNDYNHFLRDSDDPGWKVMVDLKGPGYVSRIFTTGAMPWAPFQWRFYFDGEKVPRLEGDIQEIFGGAQAPFLKPLSEYRNNCWYSFVPMPFAKGLRIECKPDWRDAKAFFQVAVSQLPRGTKVETFTPGLSAEDRAALDKAVAALGAPRASGADGEACAVAEGTLGAGVQEWTLAPGAAAAPRGGVVQRLEIEPRWDLLPVGKRDAVLRDWMLEIRWDGAAEASVKVPLGDFCGMPWRRLAAGSHYFGMEAADGALFNAFPAPFAKEMRVRLVPGDIPLVETAVRASWRPLAEGEAIGGGGLGYLHAGFRKTAPVTGGSPHFVARHAGRGGKYVGCLLAVATLDGSYWVLEGDETIRKDSEKVGQWHGTGLEDYFNAGWYYRNVMAGPLHGIFVKEAHRTVQYRIHAADPCVFEDSFDLSFERLPKQRNRNFFESTAFFYFPEPGAADTPAIPPFNRACPRDPNYEAATAMFSLWNYERFGDVRGEREYLAGRLATDLPQRLPARMLEMYRLRLAALDQWLLEEAGQEGAPLRSFIDACADPAVRAAGELVDTPEPVGYLYANMPVRIFIDGQEVRTGTGHPEQAEIFPLALAPGEHRVDLLAPDQPYPDWIFFAVKKGHAIDGTRENWLFNLHAPAGFPADGQGRGPEAGWHPVGKGIHGPPTEPYFHTAPDPVVGLFLGGEGCGRGQEGGLRGIRATHDYPGGKAPPDAVKAFTGTIVVP